MTNILTRAKAWAASAWARVKSWWKATVLAILAALGLATIPVAQDNSVTLSWDNATQYENGDPLPIEEIAETKLWRADYPVGQADGSVAKTLVVSLPPTVTTYADESLANGSYCYDATHVATNGAESAHSAEVCTTIDNRIPGSPQNLQIQ